MRKLWAPTCAGSRARAPWPWRRGRPGAWRRTSRLPWTRVEAEEGAEAKSQKQLPERPCGSTRRSRCIAAYGVRYAHAHAALPGCSGTGRSRGLAPARELLQRLHAFTCTVYQKAKSIAVLLLFDVAQANFCHLYSAEVAPVLRHGAPLALRTPIAIAWGRGCGMHMHLHPRSKSTLTYWTSAIRNTTIRKYYILPKGRTRSLECISHLASSASSLVSCSLSVDHAARNDDQ
eukprot:scaffold109085_cov41-Tisochrysis_lutea.AAC.1